MGRSTKKADQAVSEANRRKHERVRGESLPAGEYEDAYTWDTKGSKHAENRNERAAQEFSTIYGNTRPGDDWEYAGQQAGRSWRGKDGSGGSEPAVGIWKRKPPAPAAQQPAPAAPAPAAATSRPAAAAAAPAFNPSAFAAPATGGTATGGTATGGTAASGISGMPGTTISREGFDVTPHYYNAYLAGQSAAFDQRQSTDTEAASQQGTRFAAGEGFRARLHKRINDAQQHITA